MRSHGARACARRRAHCFGFVVDRCAGTQSQLVQLLCLSSTKASQWWWCSAESQRITRRALLFARLSETKKEKNKKRKTKKRKKSAKRKREKKHTKKKKLECATATARGIRAAAELGSARVDATTCVGDAPTLALPARRRAARARRRNATESKKTQAQKKKRKEKKIKNLLFLLLCAPRRRHCTRGRTYRFGVDDAAASNHPSPRHCPLQ